MKYLNLLLIVYFVFHYSCAEKAVSTRAEHVVIFGLDGVGTRALQLAETPEMNSMIASGALSVNTRTVLPSNSGPTWTSLLTGTATEHHGVRNNSWRTDNYTIKPSLRTEAGYFPGIFEHIREQRPDIKSVMLYEWRGMINMFDETVPGKVIHKTEGVDLFNAAYEVFFEERPEFMFVAIDEPDGYGHRYGYDHPEYFGCVSKYDSLIGSFIDRLCEEDMLKNTVVIITSDHGGLGRGHGGDSPNEMEIPVLFYGGPVAIGKSMEHVHLITDIIPTAAGLLGIELPKEVTGRFISEAFEPFGEMEYTPIPSVRPVDYGSIESVTAQIVEDSKEYELSYTIFGNRVIDISINADFPGAEIYYTFNPDEPVSSWSRYTEPFSVDIPQVIWAITVIDDRQSKIERVSLTSK